MTMNEEPQTPSREGALEFVVPDALQGERIDRAVALLGATSRGAAAGLVDSGDVHINDVVITTRSTRVQVGQRISVVLPPDVVVEAISGDPSVEFTVVYADADVIVVDKPAGLVVHPGRGNTTGTLVHGLLARFPDLLDLPDADELVLRGQRNPVAEYAEVAELTEVAEVAELADVAELTELAEVADFELDEDAPSDRDDLGAEAFADGAAIALTVGPDGEVDGRLFDSAEEPAGDYVFDDGEDAQPAKRGVRPGIVHRLDKGTSGLLVVGRTRDAVANLVAQLSARRVDRRYLALVWGHPLAASGLIDAPIGRSPRDPTRMAVVRDGREARTRYDVDARFVRPDRVSQVECKLESGRTHQIRVHLTAIGHPVVGDPVYGRRIERFGLRRPFLHARRLGFDHPRTGQPMSFESPIPADLAEVLSHCFVDEGPQTED